MGARKREADYGPDCLLDGPVEIGGREEVDVSVLSAKDGNVPGKCCAVEGLNEALPAQNGLLVNGQRRDQTAYG